MENLKNNTKELYKIYQNLKNKFKEKDYPIIEDDFSDEDCKNQDHFEYFAPGDPPIHG